VRLIESLELLYINRNYSSLRRMCQVISYRGDGKDGPKLRLRCT
jgi:hypothetical protein